MFSYFIGSSEQDLKIKTLGPGQEKQKDDQKIDQPAIERENRTQDIMTMRTSHNLMNEAQLPKPIFARPFATFSEVSLFKFLSLTGKPTKVFVLFSFARKVFFLFK